MMPRRSTARRRGSAFIATAWALVALTGMVLVFADAMRVEAVASANHLSEAQASAAELGAEQFLVSVVDAEVATPGSTTNVSMEAREIGGCLVWVMTPDPDDEQNRVYGLTDEGGKIDLNTATYATLLALPGMTDDLVDSILAWRGGTGANATQGAQDDYYMQLPDPYHLKAAPFDTVEELLLVKDITPDVLYGYDRNHDGMIDASELQSAGSVTLFADSGGSARGIFPFVTVYGVQASGTNSTSPAIGGGTSGSAGGQTVDVNAANPAALRNLLQKSLSANRADRIIQLAGRSRPFQNVFDFAVKTEMTSAEFGPVMTQLTAGAATAIRLSGGRTGTAVLTVSAAAAPKLNVNTAAHAALLCLPGLEDADATAILTYRQTNPSDDPTNIAWLLDVLTPKSKVVAIGGMVTGKSTCFSGDIVAVSPDGRAFKRVRVVIDGRQFPSRIIYRRDLTNLGWPLAPDIRKALRDGQSPDTLSTSTPKGNFAP
jgi:type II secretory pathway component PulK